MMTLVEKKKLMKEAAQLLSSLRSICESEFLKMQGDKTSYGRRMMNKNIAKVKTKISRTSKMTY